MIRILGTRFRLCSQKNNRTKMSKARVIMVSPLSGVIRCGDCDSAMGIIYTNKGDRRYSLSVKRIPNVLSAYAA